MYVPAAFAEDRPAVMAALIDGYPLAMLISAAAEIEANLVPMRLDLGAGTLRAHLSRANPQLGALEKAARDGTEVLAVFQGPQSYVSPGWYPSKTEHGRVVPTWNFLMVQARGLVRLIDDPGWLRAQVDDLTTGLEAAMPRPWAVGDAPEAFVAAQLRGIVGLEIAVRALTGKWKASQNRPAADRAGVAAALGPHPMAAAVAAG